MRSGRHGARGWLVALLLCWSLLDGCSASPLVLRDADPSATGALGEDGRYGVLLVERRVRVRVDDGVDVDVLRPLEADGTPARGRPVVLLVQGGLVSRDRYRWLGEHLASRGFLVIAPSHALDLAFFEQGNALDVLGTLRTAARRPGDSLAGALGEGPAAIVGHSLGGVVGAGLWDAAPDRLSHLVLLASYPQGSTLARRATGRALSIVGSADARVSEAQAGQGVRALETSGAPVTFAVIEGMNHMQVADRVSAEEAAAAGVATIDTDSARARVQWLIDALLLDLESGASGALDDPSRWPAGVREGALP